METNMDELRRLAGVSESDDDDLASTPWLRPPPPPAGAQGDKSEPGKDEDSDEDDDIGKHSVRRAMKLQEDEEDAEGSEEESSSEEEDDDESEDEGSVAEDDSAEDDGESGDEEEVEDEDAEETGAVSSSESDGESEKCPVCLGKFQGQDVGTPESCDHTFCLECIQEWSKNVNTCPVDRQVFHIIFARHDIGGKIFKQVSVEDKQMADEVEEDSPTDCEICGRSDREDRLLLCDGCDLGYHCECLDPPIDEIPIDEWFCPDCMQDRNGTAAADGHLAEVVDDTDEMLFLINENRGADDFAPLRPRRRQVARTRQSERVRAAIQVLRERRTRVRPVIQSDQSADEDENVEGEAAEPGPSSGSKDSAAVTVRRKRTTKRKVVRRKTTKKRKTRRKKTSTTKTKTGKRKTKGKRRRKGKKRKVKRTTKVKQVTPVTVKSRLATKLGLSKPPAGRTIPLVRTAGERSMDLIRSDTGITSLSILGERDSLDFFADSEDEGTPASSSTAVAQSQRGRVRQRYSKSAMRSHRPINFHAVSRQQKIQIPEPQVGGPSGCDLLGQIMEGQTMLQMQSKDVIIRRDGSLQANQPLSVPNKSSNHSQHGKSSEPVTESTDSPSQSDSNKNEGEKEQGTGDSGSGQSGSSGVDNGASIRSTHGSSDSGGRSGIAGTAHTDDSGSHSVGADCDGGAGCANDDGIEDISQAESESEPDNQMEKAEDPSESEETNAEIKSEENQNEDEDDIKTDSKVQGENSGKKDSDQLDESMKSDRQGESTETADHKNSVKNENTDSKDGKYDPFSPSVNKDCDPDSESESKDNAEEEDLEEDSQEKAVVSNEEEVDSDEEDGQDEDDEAEDNNSEEDEEQETSNTSDKEDDNRNDEDGYESDEKAEEKSHRGRSSRIPISELPRIPKIKKRRVTEEAEDDDLGEESTRKYTGSSRHDTQSDEQSYPKWEKKSRRDRRRDSSEVTQESQRRGETSERSRSERHRDSDKYDRSEKRDRSRDRDEEHRSSRRKRRRSRSRSRERNRDRHRRSRSRERSRRGGERSWSRDQSTESRSRSRSRERIRDRHRRSRSRERSRRGGGETSGSRDRPSESRSRRSRKDRSRSRERSERSHRRDQSSERRHSDRRSRSPRSSRHEERSRHRHEREKVESDRFSDESYKDVKEERKRQNANDYKASLKLFSQSIGGVSKDRTDEDTTNKKGKLKHKITESQTSETVKRRKSSSEGEEEEEDDDCEIIAVEIKPKPVLSSVVKAVTPKQENVESSIKPSKHISFKIELDKSRLSESNALQKLDSGTIESGHIKDKTQEDIVTSSDATNSSPNVQQEEKEAENKEEEEEKLEVKEEEVKADAGGSIEEDDGARDSNDTDMDIDECSYDPSEPTEPVSPPVQPPVSLPPMMPFRVGDPALGMPPRPLMPSEEFSDQGLLEGGRPPLPPGMVPGNVVLNPPHRMGMMPPHGMPPNMPVMGANMMVNSLLMNRPPPFGRLTRMPPPRIGWQMNHPPPPNVFMQQQNNFVPQMSQQPGLMSHQNGVEGLSLDPRTQPPFQHNLLHPSHQQQLQQSRLHMAPSLREVPLPQSTQPNSTSQQQQQHQQQRLPHMPLVGEMAPPPSNHPNSTPQQKLSKQLPQQSQREKQHLPQQEKKHQQLPQQQQQQRSAQLQKKDLLSKPILPLAPQTVDQLKEITKLLSTQAKLAEFEMQKTSSAANMFKTPNAPSVSVSTTTSTISTGKRTTPNKTISSSSASSVGDGLDMALLDSEVASPTEDDDLLMSFSPPPELKWENKTDKHTEKKTEKKQHRHHHKHRGAQQQQHSERREKEKTSGNSNGQDDVPSSAVELDKQTKLMKKLNHRERVVEEVKLAIKPYYAKGKIDKDDYKEIMRKAVPKVCHSKSGDINPMKIKSLVEAYVSKVRGLKKYEAKKTQK